MAIDIEALSTEQAGRIRAGIGAATTAQGAQAEAAAARTSTLVVATTSGPYTLQSGVAQHNLTLGGAHPITWPAIPGEVAAAVTLVIDCAGFTPTWAGPVTWVAGAPPTLVTTSGKANIITAIWHAGRATWLALMVGSEQ